MAGSELSKRLMVAAIGIPIVVVAIYVGRWVMGPVLAAFCAGAALEFYRLAEQNGVRPLRVLGAAMAAALVLAVMLVPTVPAAAPVLWSGTLLFLLVIGLAAIWLRGPNGRPLLAIGVTAFGALLPGGAMSYAIFLRHLPVGTTEATGEGWAALAGAALVAFPLAITWSTDSGAYFGGKRFGRRKLIPSVSPGKTVEGAVSGLVAGVLAGWIMSELVLGAWLGIELPALAGAAGGLVIGSLSQVGDLAESLWKREAGVKDSGTFFPGHGGLLDRMDSLLFTVPAAYWWLVLFLPDPATW